MRTIENFLGKNIAIIYLLILSLLYGYIVYVQYEPIFYEDQFIHIPFIKDLVENKFNLEHFLSVFGEHLFPGYSILVAINYYLFSVSLSFETILTFLFNITSALIVYSLWEKTGIKNNFIGGATAILIMLSPIQYPMKSMALIANLSVIVAFFIFYLLLSNKRGFLLYLLLTLYVIFFAGAYSAGFAIAYIAFLIIKSIENNRLFLNWNISLFISVLYIIYYLLLPISNATVVSAHVFEPIKSLDFALVMTGSSILGKAVFEARFNLIFYYFSWLLVIVTAFYALRLSIKKLDYIVVSLPLIMIVYSGSIILIASYARYQNGLDLAMGQWYQSHIKYLPVFGCLMLGYLATEKRISTLLVLLILGLTSWGYYFEYLKAPYAKKWKEEINSNIYKYLIDDSIRSDDMQTSKFYWPMGWTKDGLDLLYRNNLAYFKNDIVTGLTFDGWSVQGQPLRVICPMNSKRLEVAIGKTADSNKELIIQHYDTILSKNNILIRHNFKKSKYNSFEMLNNGLIIYNNNSQDLRKLLFHVESIRCFD